MGHNDTVSVEIRSECFRHQPCFELLMEEKACKCKDGFEEDDAVFDRISNMVFFTDKARA